MRPQKLDPQKTKKLLQLSGLKYATFCKLAGIHRKTFSEFLNGWKVLNDEQSARVLNALHELAPLLQAIKSKS